MTEQNRVAAGVPTGGQFAGHDRAEADIALPGLPHEKTLALPAFATLYLDDEPLPEYPASLPEPSVYFEFDDGRVETHITIGEDTICFWESDHGLLNTVADNDNPLTVAEGDDEIEAAVLEWGEAVHRRIDDLAYNITIDAVTPNTAKLIELALRSTPDSEPPTRGAKFLAAQARVAEAKLLEQRLAAAAIADEILAVYPQASTLVLAEDDGDGGGVWVAAGIQSVDGESIDDTEALLDDLWAEVNALPTSTPHSIEAETGAALDTPGFEWFEDARGARGGDPSAVYINLPLAKSQVI